MPVFSQVRQITYELSAQQIRWSFAPTAVRLLGERHFGGTAPAGAWMKQALTNLPTADCLDCVMSRATTSSIGI